MSITYDAIVLGTGHNSLILAAYLARAGLEVICLEPRDVAGGGLNSVERPAGSGFLHNSHAFYHRGLTQMPWYADLQLERHGANYLQPALNVALICQDGSSLQWWDDFDKTVASFAKMSPNDAESLLRWRDRFEPIVKNILLPESMAPPLPPEQRVKLLSASEDGRFLLETSQLSPLEFVTQEFEHPTVQAALLFFNGLREVDLRERGFGHHIPALLASNRMAQMCVGGAKRLADSLVAAIREAGGTIRLNVQPEQIVVQGGRVVGVVTGEGQLLNARKLVASGLNPQQTFLELIDAEHLPPDWLRKAEGFRYNLLAPLFALNLNLNEPPRYLAAGEHSELDEAFMVLLGIEHMDQFADIVRHHEAGTVPPTVMWGSCPSQFDPSHAPPGKHTAFMWEKLPYELNGDATNWDAFQDGHGAEMLELWTRFAPNLSTSVLDSFTASPLDVERTLPNMRQGDLLVGAFAGGQVGSNRPFPGAGHYRGHLDGLYLCGSCCHPGGNITGLPGYNSAQVVLADLGIDAPWAPPPIQDALAG